VSALERALAALRDDREATWAQAEAMMTDGYARVLTLEAERLHVMRELVDLANHTDTADRAAALTSKLDGIGRELTALRSTLNDVKRRFPRNEHSPSPLSPQTATG